MWMAVAIPCDYSRGKVPGAKIRAILPGLQASCSTLVIVQSQDVILLCPYRLRLISMLTNVWLGVRNLATIVLFPGTVTVYIPYRLLAPVNFPNSADWSFGQYPGAIFILLGLGILLNCVWSFAHHGRGTLAPFDETRSLVLVGLYRYVRNPMYVGVVFILLGESMFFSSRPLLIYSVIMFALFNVVVIGYEENRLRRKYGEEYRQYCAAVGRWLPGRTYRGAG